MQKILPTLVDDLFGDLGNAGAIWVNEPVLVDGNLVSSRTPMDLAAFAQAMGGVLASRQGRGGRS